MLQAVHNQTVIDLIGEDHQLMLPGHLHDLLENFLGIQRAGGVVGIDDDNGLGAGGDLVRSSVVLHRLLK